MNISVDERGWLRLLVILVSFWIVIGTWTYASEVGTAYPCRVTGFTRGIIDGIECLDMPKVVTHGFNFF